MSVDLRAVTHAYARPGEALSALPSGAPLPYAPLMAPRLKHGKPLTGAPARRLTTDERIATGCKWGIMVTNSNGKARLWKRDRDGNLVEVEAKPGALEALEFYWRGRG